VGRNLGAEEGWSSKGCNPGSTASSQVPRIKIYDMDSPDNAVLTTQGWFFGKNVVTTDVMSLELCLGSIMNFQMTARQMILTGSHGKSIRICLIVCKYIFKMRGQKISRYLICLKVFL
jgi:hypothetical protein